MSRSQKHRPYAAYTGAGSQKSWKRMGNRACRRLSKPLVGKEISEIDIVYPVMDEIMSLWDMPQDGTRRYRPFRKYKRRGLSYRDWFKWALAK